MNLFSISKIARGLAIFTITLFVLGSCEKKENTIGSGFLDGEKFGSGIYRNTKITAYTKEKEEIVTSKLPVNLIGAYQDPNFGMIKSGFGIQIALSKEDPDFGTNPIVDSVVLTMSYIVSPDSDSIFGSEDIPMSFKISQLTSLLHPDSTYYSTIELPTSDEILNNPSFIFSSDSIVLTKMDTTATGADTLITSKIAPAFREKLDNDYFQRNILDLSGSVLLATNSNFISKHINGFVFETESTDGAIYSFDMLNKATLIIYYGTDDEDIKGNPLPQQEFELVFSDKLARVNKYDFDRSTADPSLIEQLSPGYDTTQGSEFLYIQGMSGLESNIKLFTDKDQLQALRDSSWLINRAELVYRVSDDNGDDVAPPFSLMMTKSNDSLSVMIDYSLELSAFEGYLKSDATILDVNTEKRYYKFRITNHVAAILDGEIVMNESGDYEVVYDDKLNYDIKLFSLSGKTVIYDEQKRYVIGFNKDSGGESTSRVKVYGTNNVMDETKNLFLEIHYSKKD